MSREPVTSPLRALTEADGSQLTPGQREQLTALDLDFRADAARIVLERELAVLEIERAGGDFASARGVTAAGLAAVDALTAKLRQRWLDTRNAALVLMTPEQVRRLEIRLDGLPDFDIVAAAPGDANAVEAAVARALSVRLKDSKVVEVEITQAIAERLLGWAKTFGLLIGIPLGLLAVVLGVLGIRNWSDFNTTVDQGKKDIEARIGRATASAADLDVQGTALRRQAIALGRQYAELKRQFGDVSKIQTEVKTLTTKLDTLEDQIRFKGLPTGGSTVSTLKAKIGSYRAYLGKLGYVPPDSAFEFVIDPKTDMNAYFDGERLVVAPQLVGATDIILREYSQRALKELKPDAWDTDLAEVSGLFSGLSDYLPGSYLGNPEIGREFVRIYQARLTKSEFPNGYLRNLVNARRFPQRLDADYEQHSIGEVWGGVFWRLRTIVGCPASTAGCPTADRIVLDTWRAVPLGANFGKRYAAVLIAKARSAVGAPAADALRADLAGRGMVL